MYSRLKQEEMPKDGSLQRAVPGQLWAARPRDPAAQALGDRGRACGLELLSMGYLQHLE